MLVARDLDPAKVKAYRIADNRVAQDATWDAELLQLELTDLKSLAYDLPLLGFDNGELERMLSLKDDQAAPSDFTEYDEDIEIEHICPKCGYQFSGGSTAKKLENGDGADSG